MCQLNLAQMQTWGYSKVLAGEWMRKICTQGLDTVYIVGENGLIAKSTDRGNTWEKQYFSTQVAFNDILFIDHNTGFIAGEQGTILKTTNAGESWSQLTSGTTSQINAIAATEQNVIWAVGNNSIILNSVNEGETWQQINILTANNIILSDIAFRNHLGYFTGDYATVYKTEDYGETWNKQTLIDYSDSNFRFRSINLTENKTYMLMNENDLFFTNDQINWESYNLFVPAYSNYKLFFLNDIVGYRVTTYNGLTTKGNLNSNTYGYLPEILVTNNGGKDWDSYWDKDWNNIRQGQYPDNYPYLDIVLANENIGYAIFGQSLLKTPLPLIGQGIEEVKKENQLSLFQYNRNELLLESTFEPIFSVKLYNISGKELLFQQWKKPETIKRISIGNLPVGIYIIKTITPNNVISVNKWIKR
jgi:photosystem II stability/assembly factor-like uncharacterized protein